MLKSPIRKKTSANSDKLIFLFKLIVIPSLLNYEFADRSQVPQ